MKESYALKKSRGIKFGSFIRNNTMIVLLFLIIIAGVIISPSKFLSFQNIFFIIRQMSIYGIVAVGLTVVIITGNIDISIGSIITLTGYIALRLLEYGPFLAVSVALLAGILLGGINGFLVGKLKANAVITTIGTWAIFLGAAFIATGGKTVTSDFFGGWFEEIGRGDFLRIPNPVYIFLILAFIFYMILSRTALGKYFYATGGNETVASLMGVNVGNIKLLSFILLGLLGAISGIVAASRLGISSITIGQTFLFDTYTAVLLGGIGLTGGEGSIGRTMIGVIIVGMIKNVLLFSGLTEWAHNFVLGLVFIFAVLLNLLIRKRA